MKIPLPCWRQVWNSTANSLKQYTKIIHICLEKSYSMTGMWNLMSRLLIWGVFVCHFFFSICLKSPALADHTVMYKVPSVFSCIQLQSYRTHGLLQRKDQLTYEAVARKDERKVQNTIAGGQQTTLWLDHWCCAVSSQLKCLFSLWFGNTHRSH